MQRFHENADLRNKVSEVSAGTGIRDIWRETDVPFVELHTSLHDTLVNLSTGERTIIHDGDHNLITIGFGYLVAALLKGDATYGFPLSYWAVGSGEGDFWDDLSTEVRQGKSIFALEQLYNETYRVPINVTFIDDNDDPVSPGPTNRIEVQAVFGVDVVGALREFGIFGGDASAALNSGILIDHKAHTVININNTPGQQNVLIRALRITL
jgi:hypothetical protein